ncbi:hypothetical protein ACLOBQ_09295, partial [Limosilactobacillus mucosae]|uniref:hypothetical protein n=1 Tax=Limosilactobacillus mucosae TaxID=97478 RepID=UPI003EB8E410
KTYPKRKQSCLKLIIEDQLPVSSIYQKSSSLQSLKQGAFLIDLIWSESIIVWFQLPAVVSH